MSAPERPVVPVPETGIPPAGSPSVGVGENIVNSTGADYTFAVEGMTCAACVRFVEKELDKVPGVDFVSVNLATGKAYVVSDGRPEWEDLREAVTRAGYRPLREAPSEDRVEERFRIARRDSLIALAVAVPMMALMILHMTGIHIPFFPWIEAAAGLFVMLGPARGVFRGAFIALAHRHANMDSLVALGTLAAWSTAVLSIAGIPVASFGALAAMLPAFHLGGRYIEARLKRRATADVRALLDLRPETANLVGPDGDIRVVPAESVKVESRLRVLRGERIPLDSRVIEGAGAVGEAMITGEPLPASKGIGDEVTGGTILENGLLEIEVLRTGSDGTLARMLRLVEEAQGAKVPLQATADKIAGVFVPAVFLFAVVAAVTWGLLGDAAAPFLLRARTVLPWVPADVGTVSVAIYVFVSLLVIACPCALGLATPMALTAGSGLAARRGLIIKGGEAIQRAGELEVILLDKTGTLTEGHPRVVASDLAPEDRAAAAALEGMSTHPLAKGIVDWAAAVRDDDAPASGPTKEPAEVDDAEEIAGEGIRGRVGGIAYEIGRPSDFRAATGGAEGEDATYPGATVIEVRREGNPVGTITLADPVRPEAADTIAALKSSGITPVMLTGDGEGAARAVAGNVGIEEWRAGVRPEGKLRTVQEYQAAGRRVAMTGDGINDAAALKAADVGFVMGEGSDVSLEAADVVIAGGGLERIPEALAISRLTFRTIKRNLFWAFLYNALAIPMAALALVHPVMAEAAMLFSSINVILNSLAIRGRYERRKS